MFLAPPTVSVKQACTICVFVGGFVFFKMFFFFILHFLQKKRRFSGRLIALMKTGLRRGSYRIDEEEIIEAPPNFKRQKSGICDHNGNHIKHGQGKICKQAEEISLSDRIDITSRYLFPSAFLLFNIFYWFAYVYDIRVLPESARDM